MDVFSDLTGIDQIGIDDSFFALGGSSLLAMRLVARIKNLFGIEVSLRSVFEHDTVKSLSLLLEHRFESHTYTPIIKFNNVSKNSPIIFVHPAGGSSIVYKEFAEYLSLDRPIIGLQARGLEINEVPFSDLIEMIEHYSDSLSSQFPEGVLNFIGYSVGGVIAHELAVNLQNKGRKIGLLGLIDSFVPTKLDNAFDHYTEESMFEEIIANSDNENILNVHISADVQHKQDRIETIKEIFVSHNMIPRDTPSLWVERMLREMVYSKKRMVGHTMMTGEFDAVYFVANQNKSFELEKNRLSWKNYCRNIIFEDIEATHNSMMQSRNVKMMASLYKKYLMYRS